MTDADRLRAAIARLGVTQRGLARTLSIDERTVRKYCAGDLPVPQLVWLAVEALEARPAEQRETSTRSFGRAPGRA